jgi:hypothetical protein
MILLAASTVVFAAFDLFQDPVLDLLIPLAFGGAVLGVAVGMYRMEVKREPLVDKAESDSEALHLKGMIRRRKQVALLIGILGVLLMLSNSWVPWTRSPSLTTIYLLALMILVVWILLLTVGDFTANRVYLMLRLSQLHQRQREMEAIISHKKSHPETAPSELPPSIPTDPTLDKIRQADRSGHDPELN